MVTERDEPEALETSRSEKAWIWAGFNQMKAIVLAFIKNNTTLLQGIKL